MADVLLFHHVLGQTPGFLEFADALRAAGHTVHTPDLFDGRTFASIEEGADHVDRLGFGAVVERAVAEAEGRPTAMVYAGFSLGAVPAQFLAQTRPGARGALLVEACVPVTEFGSTWPDSVPVQIHGVSDDAFFAGEGDLDAARALVAAVADAELFLYEGDGHLFADPASPGHDEAAASQLLARVLDFLARC